MDNLLRRLHTETFRAQHPREHAAGPAGAGLCGAAHRRSHARGRDVQGAESQRAVCAPVDTGHQRAEHAQQGQSAGGDIHAAGRESTMLSPARRRCSPAAAGSSTARCGPCRRPSLARISWIGFRTIVIREYGRIVRIWGQTLVPSAVNAIALFRDLRQPDRPPRRHHRRLRLHAVPGARPDHDVR